MVNTQIKRSQVPQTVSQYVLKTLRERILSGELGLGTKLDQQVLASELGVSIIPLRESLRQLEAEGLVRIHPRRGAFVAQLSSDEVKETYLIREVLDDLITQLAVPNLTAEILEELGQLIEQMEQSIRANDLSKLPDLGRTFHHTIYEAAHRPLLLEIVSSIWDRSGIYRRLYSYMPERAHDILADHKKIYAACKDRDAIAAGKAVRDDLRHAEEHVLRMLANTQQNSENMKDRLLSS